MIYDINNTIIETITMDYSEKTRDELIVICKEKGIKGYSGKKKDEIVKLLMPESIPENEPIITQPANYSTSTSDKLNMVDLFAGTGAFTLAFQSTKAVNIVFCNDMVEHSKKIYDYNFDHKLHPKKPFQIFHFFLLTEFLVCQGDHKNQMHIYL